MDRGELVRQAIRDAHAEREKNTLVTVHDTNTKTITTFYKKNNAVWCKMVTGCITTESRVFKASTEEPYVRSYGKYWKLGSKEKAIVNRLAN